MTSTLALTNAMPGAAHKSADYDGHMSHFYGHGISAVVVAIVLCTISLSLVIWRMIAKRLHTIIVPWVTADYCLAFSAFFNICLALMFIVAVDFGTGKHNWQVNGHDKRIAAQLGYTGQIFYKLTINLTKLSFLFIYQNLWSGRIFKIVDVSLIVYVACYMTGSILATIFECTPVALVWEKTLDGKCLDIILFFRVNAIQNIVTDVMIFILPIPYIWRMPNLTPKKKLGIMLIFCLGFITCVTSVLRLTTIAKHGDSYDGLTSSIWTITEPNVAIMAAALPSLKSVLEELPFKIKQFFKFDVEAAREKRESEQKAAAFFKAGNGLASRRESYHRLTDGQSKDGFREQTTSGDDIEMGSVAKTAAGKSANSS